MIAAITPWNSPIASEMQKVAPALAAGNAVVLKPAEATPLMALKLAELFEQAGLPAGLLSVLPGKGSVIGEALARHPRVKKISFTGGTSTGRHLAHIAADKLIPTSLELGGKSPTIVLEDADLEQAARGICYGIFSSAGQACIAGSRLFVHRSLYQPLLARLTELTAGLRIGNPLVPGVHLGPLISAKHRQSVADYVALARQEGGRVVIGGEAPADPQLASGSYYLPTIIEGLNNDARVCQKIFGPVLVALPFDDEQQLIEQANDSVYGRRPASGAVTSLARWRWRSGWKPAPSGSIPTKRSRFPRRSVVSRKAGWVAKGPERHQGLHAAEKRVSGAEPSGEPLERLG